MAGDSTATSAFLAADEERLVSVVRAPREGFRGADSAKYVFAVTVSFRPGGPVSAEWKGIVHPPATCGTPQAYPVEGSGRAGSDLDDYAFNRLVYEDFR